MSDFYLSRQQVRELDRRAAEEYGVPGIVLMENAGRGCAELLMRLNPTQQLTAILCGPGNNGGDGFVIARHLDYHGWSVTLFVAEGYLPADAETNFEIVTKMGLPLQSISEWQPHGGWIVDALFGTGLSRGLGKPFDQIVNAIASSGQPVLAIDIPSGLDCDTGEPLGPTVKAAHTATFVAAKLGFRNPSSREWTGEVHVIGIGAPKKLVDGYRS
ncbi:NAD(P)H-hydrate epimerase [Limnoglobus roseus]|uniref:NAD(P)H-hydrate epimerase n=1 Tax=Limnoglobus roseus TaxID=2598579 RepID=A0A5C1AB28_9BACT|nr:NAD(P)H-hydrate epimerase [Limnoglobus roseus]QEL16579.1 NAD(P)H-hydrate epimerase [Limnoglobus roseus]